MADKQIQASTLRPEGMKIFQQLPKFPHQYYLDYLVTVRCGKVSRCLRFGDVVRLLDAVDEYLLTAVLKPRLLDGPNLDGGGIYAVLFEDEKSERPLLVPVACISQVVRHISISGAQRMSFEKSLEVHLQSMRPVLPTSQLPAADSKPKAATPATPQPWSTMSTSRVAPSAADMYMLDDHAETTRALAFLVSLGAHGVYIAVPEDNGIEESRVSVLDALARAGAIAIQWGCSRPVVLTALLQSVYGDRGVLRAPSYAIPARETVRRIVGETVEFMLWRLSSLATGPNKLIEVSTTCVDTPADREDLTGVVTAAAAGVLVRAALGEKMAERVIVADVALQRLLPANALQQLKVELDSQPHQTIQSLQVNEIGAFRPQHDDKAASMNDDESDDDEDTNPGLRTLLGMRSRAELQAYLLDNWPEQAKVSAVNSGPERLSRFLPQSFNDLLDVPCQFRHAFLHTTSGLRPSPIDNRTLAQDLYDSGVTIYVHGLQSPAVKRFTARVERELGIVPSTAVVVAFASRASRTARGTPAHVDSSYDFVVQVRGSKGWRIAPNTNVELPHAPTYHVGRPPSKEQHVQMVADRELPAHMPEAGGTALLMTPGTVLFLPRGFWHETLPVNDESLHVNIVIERPAWAQLVAYSLQHHLHLPRELLLRRPLRHLAFQQTAESSSSENAVFDADGFIVPSIRADMLAALRLAMRCVGDTDLDFTEASFAAFLGAPRYPQLDE